MSTIDEVLEFWFADAATAPELSAERDAFWFQADPRVDDEVRTRFGTTVAAAAGGECADWAVSARGHLALVIVLDQFPRNIHRGTAAAFAHDAAAFALSRDGALQGLHHRFPVVEQSFFLMPFQHVEDLDEQERGVGFYREMECTAPAEWRTRAKFYREFAELHRDIVRRFGRFPHRNHLLWRESTAEEAAYLAGGGQSFGQGSDQGG